MENCKSIVITVHGIRTYGSWTSRFSELLAGAGKKHTIVAYAYGYFSALAFLIPFLRWIEVRRFRKHLLRLYDRNRDADLCIIAHSFGTYVVANAIRSIPVAQRPAIERLILCGSVLKPTFDCTDLLDGGIRSIINDCCIDDSILVLSQFFVIGTGMAGRVGFYGLGEGRLVNRFHTGGHSGYFDDCFMDKWWLDVIGDFNVIPLRSDRLTSPTALDGVKHVLTGNLDPVKIFAYLVLIGWPVYYSLQAIKLLKGAEESYLADGEEQALLTLLHQRQFPREVLAGTPLQHILIKSGNYSVSYTDAEFEGRGEGRIYRTYNSRASEKGLFGVGWGSSLETRLLKESNTPVVLYHLTGKKIHFRENGKGSWIAAGFVLSEEKTGYQMTVDSGRIMRFAHDGRMIEEHAPGAEPIRLKWKNNKLVELVGVAQFAYDDNGELSRIDLGEGQVAKYRIVNRMLLDSTDVAGNHYRYEYDKKANLIAIRYDDGTRRLIGYDKLDLANYALYPNGYELKVGYGNMTKKGNWSETRITVAMTKSGKKVIDKDFTLHETQPGGRLFKTIEVVGDTRIETDYNPVIEAPIQIRALGQVIAFEYDQFGRLVRQRGKETIEISYDDKGRIAGWERRDSSWSLADNISFKYNAEGNLAQIRHNQDTLELIGFDKGLKIINDKHSVLISEARVLFDDRPVNEGAGSSQASELIARVLRTADRPTGLFEMYRPCGCNAFAATVLPKEYKRILEKARSNLPHKF